MIGEMDRNQGGFDVQGTLVEGYVGRISEQDFFRGSCLVYSP